MTTFVSTNVLSLMPLVTGRLDPAAEGKSLFEVCEGSSMGLFVRVVLTDERFDLRGKQAANRRVALGRQYFGLAQRPAVQAHGDVLLGRFGESHESLVHVLYVLHVKCVTTPKIRCIDRVNLPARCSRRSRPSTATGWIERSEVGNAESLSV